MISDTQTLDGAKTRFDNPIPVYDDGMGTLWISRDSMGIVGIVRALSWEDAYDIVLDEFAHDADPNDPDTYATSYDPSAEPGELAEGCYYRPNSSTKRSKAPSFVRESNKGQASTEGRT